MAVFPDKIVLKHSSDTLASIEAAIGPGGSDEITSGEIVVAQVDNGFRLYSLDRNGALKAASSVPDGTGAFTEYKTDSGLAAAGVLELTGLGRLGTLVDISVDLDAWVVFYPTAAARTADAGRPYSVDPEPGSGVLAEAYVTSAASLEFSPAAAYFNFDSPRADVLYLAVRDQSGVGVNATVTVGAYTFTQYDGFSGGTYGSG